MNFDAFISYANQDKAAADAACAKLEAEGIRCWIAPRDVPPGAQWAGAIVDAIDHCRAMVVIFSSSANASKQIHREVQRAFDREVPVVPFRIENVAPEQSLAYYMGSVHWLDALTPPLEQHLQKLAASVKPFVHTKTFGEDDYEEHGRREAVADTAKIDRSWRPEPRKPWQPSRWLVLTAWVLGIVLFGSAGVWLGATYWRPVESGPQSVKSSPPSVTLDSNTVTLQTGLVGYWPLNGKTTDWATNITQDTSGNGNDGILFNMPMTTSPLSGKNGDALSFSGTSSVQTPYRGISGTSARTIALWLKTRQTIPLPRKNTSTLLAYGDARKDSSNSCLNPGYFVVATNDKYGGSVNYPGISVDFPCNAAITYDAAIYDNQWHHVAVVMPNSGNTSNLKILVDGNLLTTINNIFAGSYNTGSGTSVQIGNDSYYNFGDNTNSGFQGALHDVRIYNRALSAQEVAQLYSMGQ
jgi:hypothetical protein